MERLAAYGFAFTLPAEWEVTAFHLAAAKGEFRFSNRLAPVGRLAWMKADRPDLERFVREAVASEAQRDTGEIAAPAGVRRIGPFTVAWGRGGRSCHAASWIANDHRLLHWTFLQHSDQVLDQLWAPLLASQEDRADRRREWSLLGLHGILPFDLEVEELDAQPGSSVLTLVRKDGLRVRLRRYGMASVLLGRAPLHHLYRRVLLGDRVRVDGVEPVTTAGRPTVRALFSVRGEQAMDRVIWRRHRGDGLMIHRAEHNRIHAVDQIGPPSAERLELAHVLP